MKVKLLVLALAVSASANAQLNPRICVDGRNIDPYKPLPLYEPCNPQGLQDIQLNYGQTIDFADYSTKIEPDHSLRGGGLPIFEGWVWIKVQGQYKLIPYYKSPQSGWDWVDELKR